MNISQEDFNNYVFYAKKIDSKYREMDAVMVDGIIKWVKSKTNEIKDEIETPSKRKKKKKRKSNINKISSDNFTIRHLAKQRDHNRCAECGSVIDLEVHHIEYRSNGGTDELNNLITLCAYCHYEQHKNEPIAKLMLAQLKRKGLR